MQLTRRLDVNHDITFGRGLANFAVESEATAQNVRTRMMLLLDEWFLDTSVGVPWLQKIMVKPADIAYTAATLKRTILETDGVSSIESFTTQYDSSTRVLTVNATVKTVYGDTLNIQVP